MVELFGNVERSFREEDNNVTVFKIPAISKSGAKRRASLNARLKGLLEYEVGEPQQVRSDQAPPGGSIYHVRVTS